MKTLCILLIIGALAAGAYVAPSLIGSFKASIAIHTAKVA